MCVCIFSSTVRYRRVHFSCSVLSDSLRPHELQPARLPCPSPIPRACSNSCPSSWWCHPTISSSVVPFSSWLQSPASGSFPMCQFFASGGQSVGVSASASASVLPIFRATFLLDWLLWSPCSPRGHKALDVTEWLNWTKLIHILAMASTCHIHIYCDLHHPH